MCSGRLAVPPEVDVLGLLPLGRLLAGDIAGGASSLFAAVSRGSGLLKLVVSKATVIILSMAFS